MKNKAEKIEFPLTTCFSGKIVLWLKESFYSFVEIKLSSSWSSSASDFITILIIKLKRIKSVLAYYFYHKKRKLCSLIRKPIFIISRVNNHKNVFKNYKPSIIKAIFPIILPQAKFLLLWKACQRITSPYNLTASRIPTPISISEHGIDMLCIRSLLCRASSLPHILLAHRTYWRF